MDAITAMVVKAQEWGAVSVMPGLHVNFAKSSALMICSDETDTERVAGALPWRMDTFPCKYLGMQLSIKQLTRSD
ncbi:hypothetical protein D1007_00015 [Hordeum vulgare]|nr:hypothetical protein D1007_00015 [Hordeum vulgare]